MCVPSDAFAISNDGKSFAVDFLTQKHRIIKITANLYSLLAFSGELFCSLSMFFLRFDVDLPVVALVVNYLIDNAQIYTRLIPINN